jgi:hypothetical protein
MIGILFSFLGVLIFFFILAVVAFDLFGLIEKENQKFIQHWEHIASQVTFQIDIDRTEKSSIVSTLTGKIHRYDCSIVAEISRGQEHTIRSVRFEVHHPQSLQLDLGIGPQGKLVSFLSLFTGKEIPLEDEFFDKHFFVQGRDAATINQFLTLERKTAIYNAQQAIAPAQLAIGDSTIVGYLNTERPNLQQVIHVMNQLVAIEATFGDPVQKEPDFWDAV